MERAQWTSAAGLFEQPPHHPLDCECASWPGHCHLPLPISGTPAPGTGPGTQEVLSVAG